MRLRAGLHLVFTREVLEEIPTAMLAITKPWVTSYSKKKVGAFGWGVGGVGGERGEGSVKHVRRKERKRRRVNVQHFVPGYHGLISHEHLLEERVSRLSWECLHSHLHAHTPSHSHKPKAVLSCFLFLSVAWKQLQGRCCSQKAGTCTHRWKECVPDF